MYNYEFRTMLDNETIDMQIMHISDMFAVDQCYENFGLRICLEKNSQIAGKTFILIDKAGEVLHRKTILPSSLSHQHYINEVRTFVEVCNVASLIHLQDESFLRFIVKYSANQMRYLEDLVRGEGYLKTLQFVHSGGYREIQDMLLATVRLP